MTISQFNKPTIRQIRPKLAAALKDLADNHGINIDVGNASFDKSSCTFKLVLSTRDESGLAQTPEVMEFKRSAELVGLKSDDLGRRFRSNGRIFEITGMSLNARRYPIMAKRVTDGKVYKFHQDSVRNLF